jgi:hypothetical protein
MPCVQLDVVLADRAAGHAAPAVEVHCFAAHPEERLDRAFHRAVWRPGASSTSWPSSSNSFAAVISLTLQVGAGFA